MRGGASPRIGEAHMVKFNRRRDVPNWCAKGRVAQRRRLIEHTEDADRRRLSHHALMHQGTHVA